MFGNIATIFVTGTMAILTFYHSVDSCPGESRTWVGVGSGSPSRSVLGTQADCVPTACAPATTAPSESPTISERVECSVPRLDCCRIVPRQVCICERLDGPLGESFPGLSGTGTEEVSVKLERTLRGR